MGTLIVHPNNHPYDSDLLKTDEKNNIICIQPKPHPENLIFKNLVNAAVYILSPEIINYIDADEPQDFGKNIFPKVLADKQMLKAYQTAEYIKDMGTKERLLKICEDIQSGKVRRLNKINKRPAIFLDRDGVLNQDMDNHPCAENLELLPRVADAVRLINNSDFLSIVVTNQPMIAKGFVTSDEVERTNEKLEMMLGKQGTYLDKIYYCPHHPEKGFPGEIPHLKIECNCRKPKPGMLLKAVEEFNIDLSSSWMIGDRETDLQAGKSAGCRTVLAGQTIDRSDFADYYFDDLLSAVTFICGEKE
jgi:histidinol-phosphate phosphatase family protein